MHDARTPPGRVEGGQEASSVLEIRAADPSSRFIFRGGERAAGLAGAAFGVALPLAACRSNSAGSRHALWLGPEEWLLMGADEDREAIERAVTEALTTEPHALVDLGDGNIGLIVSGAAATDILNASCPLDLDAAAFPVGMCARTLFGKAEIVLWRTASMAFRIEVSRSFRPYAQALLVEAAREHRP